MAGNYMDAPSDRVAWDRDGSILSFISASNVITVQLATVRRLLNSEDETLQTMTAVVAAAVVFPIPLDCVAVFVSATAITSTGSIETSKDTTNGVDGTWDTQYLTNLNFVRDVKPNYRISSELFVLQTNSSSSELRGIRIKGFAANTSFRALHIYGSPSTLATKDRLEIWNPTTDVGVTPQHFDWGNVPRSTSADKSFRIKNLSPALTATDIDLYVESLTAGVPSVAGMHTISADGGSTFLTNATIAQLLPGEISSEFILRRTIPANSQVGVWSARLAADVNLWEE